uniref:Ankyrin repeat and SOCS box containing 3 n=1 Tax=Takifugu rubripes TaxID=31033 RepID=H2T2M1_TAKRU
MDFTECYGDTVSSVAAAARTGCWKQVRRLIRRGFSVDCRDNRGWNALHEAAAAGSKECVKEILATVSGSSRHCRIFVNSLTHEGESACYLAAKHGHVAVVQLLLRARADFNHLTNDSSCPLYAAVHGGYKDIVELLVRHGAEVNGTHTASCWTCLHQAVYEGHSEIVQLLVGVCNLEALDDHNISPLFLAAQYGKQECLEILVNAGANVNTQAADLATPLLIASQEGHQNCVEFLLDHGADPNVACSRDWPQLAIHAAAEFGHIGLIAATDRVCDQGDGMVSPIYVAVNRHQSGSVRALLSEGYSPDAQDCTHVLGLHSPLSLALMQAMDFFRFSSFSESVRLLVAAGAHLKEEDWLYALHEGKIVLELQELRELLCVALEHVQFAPCWLPVLLKAGLQPSLLLQPHVLEHADGDALNYLLEFVNWTTLPKSLKSILDRRREEQTWKPWTHFDTVVSLSHICRLQIRLMLGPDLLMRTSIVQQLPVPPSLHQLACHHKSGLFHEKHWFFQL